jgi:hypothetical protein
MPRDLLADRKTLDAMPQLSSQNALVVKKMEHIHPFAQLLNYEDLDDCDWLEHAAFDPIEAATREKVNNQVQFHITTVSRVDST